MKKVRVSKRGYMNVEIYYDEGIEIEVPDDMDESEVEEFVDNNEDLKEQFDIAVREGIQSIHDKLKNVELEYSEEGGYDEIWVDEIPGDYLQGKKDLAKDILDKIKNGYGENDILDLIKAWGNTENLEKTEDK